MRPTLLMSDLGDDQNSTEGDRHYRVAWKINPHMAPGTTDLGLARGQHRGLAQALVDAGADIVEAPFVTGAYDSVFMKDAALLHAGEAQCTALIARFRHAERAPESIDRATFLAAWGAKVVHAEVHLEGGDVALTDQCVYLGYGFRSERCAAPLLRAHFARPVVALRLIDPRLYHLDMALCLLPDRTALVCREAFTAHSLRALERSVGIREVVAVSLEDALSMCLNVVTVGDTVVGGHTSPRVASILSQRKLRQHIVPLDQFHRAGGGAACLVARVYGPASEQREQRTRAA